MLAFDHELLYILDMCFPRCSSFETMKGGIASHDKDVGTKWNKDGWVTWRCVP